VLLDEVGDAADADHADGRRAGQDQRGGPCATARSTRPTTLLGEITRVVGTKRPSRKGSHPTTHAAYAAITMKVPLDISPTRQHIAYAAAVRARETWQGCGIRKGGAPARTSMSDLSNPYVYVVEDGAVEVWPPDGAGRSVMVRSLRTAAGESPVWARATPSAGQQVRAAAGGLQGQDGVAP